MATTEAGVVVGIGDKLFFAPATAARIVTEQPPITPVPGTALGMTLIDGRVIPVITVGPDKGPLLLCEAAGERVALTGLTILGSGAYPAVDGGVSIDGRDVARLDVASRMTAAAARHRLETE
jgi:hypothetical protein